MLEGQKIRYYSMKSSMPRSGRGPGSAQPTDVRTEL